MTYMSVASVAARVSVVPVVVVDAAPLLMEMLVKVGAVVSMIVVTELLAALWFNAASVAFAVRV